MRVLFQPIPLFVLLSTIYGALFLVVTPPFQAPDEYEHFFRAFHVSEGQVFAQKQGERVGDYLPRSLSVTASTVSKGIPFHPENKQNVEDIWPLLDLPLDAEQRVFLDFPSYAIYSPGTYVPQVTGILLGKLFDASPLLLMYLGRALNLFAWMALVVLALRLTPVFHWGFVLIALTPMSLFLASSLSADAWTSGLSFLLIAMILRAALSNDLQMDRRYLVGLVVVSVLLSCAKQGYIVLLGLTLLIPHRKFPSFSHYFGYLGFLALLNLAVAYAWSTSVRDLVIPANPAEPNISMSGQVLYILQNPLDYAMILFHTVKTHYQGYLHQFVGVLGWLDAPLPKTLAFPYIAFLVAVGFLDSQTDQEVSWLHKLWLLLVASAGIVLILTGIYMKWNSVGKPMIEGPTGRYFIPFAPLLGLLLYNRKLSFKTALPLGLLSFGACSYLLTHTLFILLERYY